MLPSVLVRSVPDEPEDPAAAADAEPGAAAAVRGAATFAAGTGAATGAAAAPGASAAPRRAMTDDAPSVHPVSTTFFLALRSAVPCVVITFCAFRRVLAGRQPTGPL